MLTPPPLAHDLIIACARTHFGLHAVHAAFLPIGADANSAVYRVVTHDGTPFLLKLRRGSFNEVAVAVPAWLHAQGMDPVMAPLATSTNQWWAEAHGFAWIVYPFFAGENGFRRTLSPTQWVALGTTMRYVHAARLPAALEARMPRETWASHHRHQVQAWQQDVTQRTYDDPIAAQLAAFFTANHAEIARFVAGANHLAAVLPQRPLEWVVCHADLHAGNVLVGTNDALAIVDWDEVILAPKERDLMFVGGGVGDVWNDGQEERWFYEGYGNSTPDPLALAYYRYERIVADLAAYAAQIFGMQGSAVDRAQGVHELREQFRPGRVVEIAHRSYAALP